MEKQRVVKDGGRDVQVRSIREVAIPSIQSAARRASNSSMIKLVVLKNMQRLGKEIMKRRRLADEFVVRLYRECRNPS